MRILKENSWLSVSLGGYDWIEYYLKDTTVVGSRLDVKHRLAKKKIHEFSTWAVFFVRLGLERFRCEEFRPLLVPG